MYQTEQDEGTDLWVMRSDGSEARRITNDAYYDGYPGWSPDGKWLVYDSERDGNKDLYIVPVESGTERRVTMDSRVDQHPSWSPDGRSLAFHSVRSGNLNIWIVEIPDLAAEAADDDAKPSLDKILVLGSAMAAAVVLLRRRDL